MGRDTELRADKLIKAFAPIEVQEPLESNVTVFKLFALEKAFADTELQLGGIASVVNNVVPVNADVPTVGHCPPFSKVSEFIALHW